MDDLRLGLLDELCDKLDESGIKGNVIQRDSYGEPYVKIWPGSFKDYDQQSLEMFTVVAYNDGCYEIKPPNKYYDYFIKRFRACRSRKNGYYIMSVDSMIRTIGFLFDKENEMEELEKATRELCLAIARDNDKSPVLWSISGTHGSICIHNLTNNDKLCIVKAVYEVVCSTSEPLRIVYCVNFSGKYCAAAREIQKPVAVGTILGYKFVSPKHVIDFVKDVVRKTDEMERKPIMMKWEVRSYDLITPFIKERFAIKDVIFNDPATIVIWADGSKTVVKAENEKFDPEKGLAMAISKRVFGNKHNYYDIFKKYVGRYEKKQKKGGK